MTASKEVILATFGTLGDIYPFIAIAHALAARGFTPTIVAPGMHQASIEDEGILYARLRPHERDITTALGVDIKGAFELMLKNPHFILDEIYMRFLRETYEDVLDAGRGARLILTHSLLVGAAQAAEALGIPSARIALAPLHLQSALAPPLTPGAPYCLRPRGCSSTSYNRLVRRVVRLATRARMGRLRNFRAMHDLPSTQEDFFLDFGRANTADAVFGLFSAHFSPKQADHPKNLIVTGFPFYQSKDPERRTLPTDLDTFLAAGDPPIIFTLGSFAPEVSGSFYDESLRAARALGRRAVLLAGSRDAARLAPLVSHREYVCARAPHGRLFPRALCVVHHGGIGTTAESIRAGKPQIVVPFFGDQPDHGLRVERLGLGLALTLSAYNERSVTAALGKLLAGPYGEDAQAFARRIANEPGATAIADWADAITATNTAVESRHKRARYGR